MALAPIDGGMLPLRGYLVLTAIFQFTTAGLLPAVPPVRDLMVKLKNKDEIGL